MPFRSKPVAGRSASRRAPNNGGTEGRTRLTFRPLRRRKPNRDPSMINRQEAAAAVAAAAAGAAPPVCARAPDSRSSASSAATTSSASSSEQLQQDQLDRLHLREGRGENKAGAAQNLQPLRRMSASLMNGVMRVGFALMGGRDESDDAAARSMSDSMSSELDAAGSGESARRAQAAAPPPPLQVSPRAADGPAAAAPLPALSPHALPAGTQTMRYEVQDGDTINGVAMRHGMTVGQLRQLNRIFGSSLLFPGQVVLVRAPDVNEDLVSADAAQPPPQPSSASLLPQLNALAGQQQRRRRQRGDASAPADGSAPARGAWRQERRRSTLGGNVFDGVTLVDRKIRVRGVLEVNAFYVGFTPLHFVADPSAAADSAAGTAAASAAVTSPEAIRLLRAYQFRLDVRDIQGCSAARRRTAAETAAALARAQRQVTVGAMDVVCEEGTTAEEAASQPSQQQDAQQQQQQQGHEASLAPYRVQLFWACAAAGLADPAPITLDVDAEQHAADMTQAVQTELQAARAKASRYHKLKVPEADSVTSGALLSGLLVPLPTAEPQQHGQEQQQEQEQAQPAAFRRSRSASFTAADAVQQRLMNGDISAAEAEELRRKAAADAQLKRPRGLGDDGDGKSEGDDDDGGPAPSTAAAGAAAAESGVSSASKGRSAKKAHSRSASVDDIKSNSSGIVTSAPLRLARVEARVLPKWLGPRSRILDDDAVSRLTALNGALPLRLSSKAWTRAYDFDSCGVSLKLLYKHAAAHPESMLLVRTTDGVVFGAFATETWTPTRTREFYGTGESFVFRFGPSGGDADPDALQLFRWTGANHFVMSSSASHMGMGAGGGFAFCLSEDLDNGSCAAQCETFGIEEPLCGAQTFRVAELELIAFVMPVTRKLSVSSEGSEPRSLFEAER